MTVRFPNSPPPANGSNRTGQAAPAARSSETQTAAPTQQTDPATPAAPIVTQETGTYADTPVKGGVSFPDRAALPQALPLGVANQPHSLSTSLTHLRQSLDYCLRTQPAATPDQRARIEDAIGSLDLFLRSKPDFSKPEARAALRFRLQELSGRLQEGKLLTPQVRSSLNEVVISSVEAMGKSVKLPLQVATNGSRIGGLVGPQSGVSPAQQAVVADSGTMLRAVSALEIVPGKLDGQKLLILGLRDKLLSLAYEMMLPPPADVKPGETKYEDQIMLLNGVQMLDEMIKGQEVPASLLADMTKLVSEAAKQGGSGLKQAFDALVQSGSQLQQAGAQINSTTSTIQSLVNTLKSLPASTPNMVSQFNSVISSYAASSTAATASLPTLPFPITMPVPLNVGTPPNQMTIPAGSTLSSSGGNFTLTTNGMSMMSGGTNIQTTNATIQLGPTLDNLNIASLTATSGGTTVSSTGNVIQVNKATNSSLIQAQNVNVNWGTGQVTMTGVNIVQNPNSVQLAAQNLAYSDATTTVGATGVNLGQTVQNGVTNTTGSGSNVNIANGGTVINAGELSFNMTQDANTGTSGISFSGKDVVVTSGKDVINVGKGDLNILTNADGSSVTTLATKNGSWTNGSDSVTTSATAFQINQDASGQIQNISAYAKDLTYTDGQQTVDVKNGTLNANYGANGQLSQLTGAAGKVDWVKGAESLSATGVTGQVNYGANGQPTQLVAGASSVVYTDGKSIIDATNGSMTVNYDSNGAFKDATVSGDSLNYTSTGSTGKPVTVGLGSFTGNLTANASGGQDLSFNGTNLNVTADKTTANIPEIKNLQISTDASGQISSLHVELPGTSTVATEDLNAALTNVNVDYKEKVLTATAEQVTGNITQPDLSGTFALNGTTLIDTDKYTSVHIDSATLQLNPELSQKLKDQYHLDVENIDLVLDKNTAGQLTGGSLSFEKLAGSLKGYTVTGTNEAGKQMVLSFGLSDDGKWVQQLGFEIPKGGELTVNKGEDWFLKLGGDQKFNMTYDDKTKIYNFTADNLNGQFINSDLQVDVSGLRGDKAHLDISLTPDKGLVINDISKLHGKITVKGVDGLKPITIDIDEMKGFYLKQTNMSGDSQGMMLHLAPTSDSSTLTASIKTSYHGIPIGVSFKDVHELKVGGSISTNNARVYIGDPSGRGQIEIQAGPLKLKGSEIDVRAKYNMYDPQRMLNSLDKLNSENSVKILGRVLTADPVRGKVTLDTSNRRGPYLQLNLLTPSPATWMLKQTGLPQYLQGVPGLGSFTGIRPEGYSLMLGTGARFTTGGGLDHGGTDHQIGLDVGLMDGSFLQADFKKGRPYLAVGDVDIPLPKHFALGTTPYAGLNYHGHSDAHTLGIWTGVFMNPAALTPEKYYGYLYENPGNLWGATAGLKYQHQSGTFLNANYIGTGNDPKQFLGAPSANDPYQGWNHTFTLNAGGQF